MGKMATVGLAATVFGSMMNITGATLATWWRERPLRDEAQEELPETTTAPAAPAGDTLEHNRL